MDDQDFDEITEPEREPDRRISGPVADKLAIIENQIFVIEQLAKLPSVDLYDRMIEDNIKTISGAFAVIRDAQNKLKKLEP